MRLLFPFPLLTGFLPFCTASICQIDDETVAKNFSEYYTRCWDKTEIHNEFPLDFSDASNETLLKTFLQNKEVILGGVSMKHSSSIRELFFPKLKSLGVAKGNYSLEIIGNLLLKEMIFAGNTLFQGSIVVRGNRYLSFKSINKLKILVGDRIPCDLQSLHEFFCYSSDIVEDKVKGCMVALGDFIFDQKNPLTSEHEESFRSVRAIKGKVSVTASNLVDIQLLAQVENISCQQTGPSILISGIEGLQNVNLSRLRHLSSRSGNRLVITGYRIRRSEFEELAGRINGTEGLIMEIEEEPISSTTEEGNVLESKATLVLTCAGGFAVIVVALSVYVFVACRKEKKKQKREQKREKEKSVRVETEDEEEE